MPKKLIKDKTTKKERIARSKAKNDKWMELFTDVYFACRALHKKVDDAEKLVGITNKIWEEKIKEMKVLERKNEINSDKFEVIEEIDETIINGNTVFYGNEKYMLRVQNQTIKAINSLAKNMKIIINQFKV